MENESVILGENLCVNLDLETLKLTVRSGSMTWISDESSPPSLCLSYKGREHTIPFTQAKKIRHERWQRGIGTGIKTEFSEFELEGDTLSLQFETLIWIDNITSDLHFEFIPIFEGCSINKVFWPSAFRFDKRERENYTVLPMRQGIIIPNNWDDEVELVFDGEYCCMGFYMPWWGQIEGNNGYIAIVETPWDAACNLQHPPGGPTTINTAWNSSLGSIGYKRKVQYTFFDSCDYNVLCKFYRNYVKQKGNLVTLREKVLRNPSVEKLIGTYIVHDMICYYIKPSSIFYDKDNPDNNYRVVPFRERVQQLKALKEKGVEKVYFHMDGWGRRGYDNLHPDILPPCEEAGGWDGMTEIVDACREMGYIIATHDQYYDCYLDAGSYDPEQSVHNELGELPHICIWFGGEQALLCPEFSLNYLMRNLKALNEKGITLDGIYLDGFSAAPLVECHHPEHRVTHLEGIKKRRECFNYCTSKGMLVSSEECVDWAVPYLDIVHHGPYPLTPKYDDGKPRGIPVPLFNLVYHDCIILPWSMNDGSGGIPEGDSGFLHGMLNAGIPYLSICADSDQIGKYKIICDLHKRVGLNEMVRHEFLDENYRIQKTVFSDGTEVCVNFDTGEYVINPEE